MKERWPEMLEYEKKVQEMTKAMGMTDLERADWAKELLLSWMQTLPGGVHQSSIAATEFQRLVKMLTTNVQQATAAARREGAAWMRKEAVQTADDFDAKYEKGSLGDAIRALPLTPEEPT